MNQQGTIAAMGAVGGGPGGVNAMGGMAAKQPSGDSAQLLNTYIYDYLLRNRHYDLARSFIKNLNVTTSPNPKQSPGQRNVNGVDDSMDTDSKEDMDRPDDLPNPGIPAGNASDNSFLFDWWCQFWDVFAAQRGKGTSNPRTSPYVAYSKQNLQMRNERNSQLLNAPNYNMMRNMPPGSQQDLQKRMSLMKQNTTPAQFQALQQAQAKNMMANGMQRDGSGMNMGDQRPQSPSVNGDNAPSPSKRPRLEGNMMTGQMGGPGGRSQPMQGPQMGATSAPGGNQMMMANGIPQNDMGPNAFAGFGGQGPNGQQKPMEGMNPNGAPPAQQMVPQVMEGSSDLFAGNANAGRMPGGPNGPGVQQGAGNHALQDYQMQLMLLEQQNKKRLLMARQEQDNLTQGPHPGGVGGQPGGFGAPAMSPQGSRAGPSPNPADQIKRATPKMNQQGLPGSPMPDGSMPGNRASPIPNGTSFDQMPAGMPPQYYQNGPGGMAGPNSMRPPSSHPNPNFSGPMNQQQQIEAMRQRGQMANGMWQQQQPQMMNPAPQQPHMGTPQQRNSAMPPPPAPQNGVEQQRTQPPSPQQNTNNPPTPSQSNKPAPKGKKEKADNKKKIPKKNSTAATGATPASEADQPTPTPSTPITPMHPNSFKNGQQQAGGAQNQQQSAPTQQVAAAPQMDANNQPPFGALDNDPNLDLNFASLDGPDVLETFDFDSFLHTEDTSGFGAFDTSFAFPNDGVEAGEGMG